MKRLIQGSVLVAVCLGIVPLSSEATNQHHNYGGCATWCCFAVQPNDWCWTDQSVLIHCSEFTGPRYCSEGPPVD